MGEESFTELVEVKSAVIACVVAFEEEVGFFGSGEHSDSGKSVSEISDGDGSVVTLIEDSESVVKVEVGLQSKRDL